MGGPAPGGGPVIIPTAGGGPVAMRGGGPPGVVGAGVGVRPRAGEGPPGRSLGGLSLTCFEMSSKAFASCSGVPTTYKRFETEVGGFKPKSVVTCKHKYLKSNTYLLESRNVQSIASKWLYAGSMHASGMCLWRD